MKAWPVLGIFSIASILFSAHWLVYETLIAFGGDFGNTATVILRVALIFLSFSFILAALLSYRFSNFLVRTCYTFAAVWLGFLNFFFFAACLSWLTWFAMPLAHLHMAGPVLRIRIGEFFLLSALLAGVYGVLNAFQIRVRRVRVRLPNLPAHWCGRTAVVISDLHLGHVNGAGFCRRISEKAAALQPDIVFLPGDVFDGSRIDAERMAAPLQQLCPQFGIYFATGNHDEFGDSAHFLSALAKAGVRILSNEKAVVEGLQIVGVPYHETTHPMRLRATLEALQIDRTKPSVLLSHVPNRLPIAEEAGVNLQLSGHTHGGQFIPFTWLTRRIFGKFTYGLHGFGAMQVYTSYGAGTWGPPMRIGSSPEIVLLQFDS